MIPFPDKKYQVIYADPPWTMGKSHKARVYCPQYDTMDLDSICSLPVSEIAAKNAALFLWCLNGQIENAIRVMHSWGFSLRTVAFVWVKTSRSTGQPNCRVGHWTLNGTEQCLLGVRGSMRKVTMNVRQVYMGPRQRHSQKPEEIRNRIVDLFGDVPRIELFARQRVEGWDAWGNEIEESPVLGEELLGFSEQFTSHTGKRCVK